MNENKTIKSLWIGNHLSPLELLSINSYLHNGHELELYTYNNIVNVPAEVKLKDARVIIPENEMIAIKSDQNLHGLPNFSDFFRYKLLYELGGWWSDLDAVCLRPYDFNQEYVFMQEFSIPKKPISVGGVMKCPVRSPIMEFCFSKAYEMHSMSNKYTYTSVGPDLMDKAVEVFNLRQFSFPPSYFAPIPWFEINHSLFSAINKLEGSYSLHLYNSIWDGENLPRYGLYPRDSLFENLKRQYGVHTSLSDLFKELWCDVRTFGPGKGSVKVIKKLYHLMKTYLQ